MALEKLYCSSCKAQYSVEWDEDALIDFVEPEYCPMCGSEVNDEEEDFDTEWDE